MYKFIIEFFFRIWIFHIMSSIRVYLALTYFKLSSIYSEFRTRCVLDSKVLPTFESSLFKSTCNILGNLYDSLTCVVGKTNSVNNHYILKGNPLVFNDKLVYIKIYSCVGKKKKLYHHY